MISAKAGITKVEINEAEDCVIVTVLNPEHLINTMISGMGYIASDLSSTDPATNLDLEQRFHNLNDYFDIYGERKPNGELSSQYSPSIDDDQFAEELKFRLSELSLDDVAQGVIDYIEAFDEELSCEELTKWVPFSAQEIKQAALKLNQENKAEIENKVK